MPQPRFSCVAAAKILFYLYEHRLALISVVDDLHQAVFWDTETETLIIATQAVEGAAAVGDAAHLGVVAYEDASLGVLVTTKRMLVPMELTSIFTMTLCGYFHDLAL